MKKLLAIAVILTAFAASESFAQFSHTTAGTQATVTLNVLTAPSITLNRNMNFGTIYQGVTTATVDPVNGGGNAAMFTVQGDTNESIAVNWTSSANLTNGVSNNIPWTPSLSGYTSNVQTSSNSLTSGGTVAMSSAGYFYVWGGGTATLAANQPGGQYSGTLTITVSY